MKLYTLSYFKEGKSVYGEEVEYNKELKIDINLEFILSISEVRAYVFQVSGKVAGKYAQVTMSNSDRYFIREEAHKDLVDEIEIRNTYTPPLGIFT